MNDSAVTCDNMIDANAEAKSSNEANSNKEETKTFPTSFNKKTTQNSYILLTFLLITIALLIAVSIYCYLIKYQAK